MYAFFMALFGALCWGMAPAFGKIGLKGINPLDGLAARTVITAILVFGFFFVSGGGLERLSSISARCWFFLALEAFLATFAGDLAYYAAIKSGDIGKTALILSISPLITLWLGWQFMGEYITPLQLVGAILIVTGIIFIGVDLKA